MKKFNNLLKSKASPSKGRYGGDVLKKHKKKLLLFLIIFIYWLFCLPSELFKVPTSTIVESSNGNMLGARIADDGQWRFPKMDSVPNRFEQSIAF
jgi:penicillin-binding protein 1C